MSDTNTRKQLWENVSALMQRRYGGENLTRLAKEAKVGPGSATRLKEQRTSVGIDILDKLARLFKVEPWQLLAPGLEERLPSEPADQAATDVEDASRQNALTDDQGSGASPNTSKSMVAADRAETIRLMIGNGKIEEARAYAQTPEERAIVARAAPPKSRRQVTPTGELIDKVAAAKGKAAKDMGDTLSKAYKP